MLSSIVCIYLLYTYHYISYYIFCMFTVRIHRRMCFFISIPMAIVETCCMICLYTLLFDRMFT